ADKEGFFRSARSLIQIVGRAARNVNSNVIFFADRITDSMKTCLDETSRRRSIQTEYNLKHGITPQTIIKSIPEDMRKIYGIRNEADDILGPVIQEAMALLATHYVATLEKTIRDKSRQMQKFAAQLEFERASEIRNEIQKLKSLMLEHG
ncbi:MAG: UvrB/UvrC motif-containing protein, partial [Proteobacteria bacterium]|nr:UvrB/UvrC motif-containing protein [Pseudomonadota bacterium]